MLKARQPAPLIQINPRSGAALQLWPGLPGLRGSGLSGRSVGKEVIEGQWNETGPKVRVGGGHNFACNTGLARSGGSDRSQREKGRRSDREHPRKLRLGHYALQFELNVVNPDKIRRLFSGMEDMEIFYYRCQI